MPKWDALVRARLDTRGLSPNRERDVVDVLAPTRRELPIRPPRDPAPDEPGRRVLRRLEDGRIDHARHAAAAAWRRARLAMTPTISAFHADEPRTSA